MQTRIQFRDGDRSAFTIMDGKDYHAVNVARDAWLDGKHSTDTYGVHHLGEATMEYLNELQRAYEVANGKEVPLMSREYVAANAERLRKLWIDASAHFPEDAAMIVEANASLDTFSNTPVILTDYESKGNNTRE